MKSVAWEISCMGNQLHGKSVAWKISCMGNQLHGQSDAGHLLPHCIELYLSILVYNFEYLSFEFCVLFTDL
jgi:hypothetical protein